MLIVPTSGRRVPAMLVLFALILWWALRPPSALAHAEQARSSPQPGAVLAVAPSRVDVWFTEHLTAGVSAIQVFDAARRRVDRGDTRIDPTDGRHMSVDLAPLPSGLYTVVWSNVSADDGHPNKGGFAFTVALPTPTAAVAASLTGTTAAPAATATAAPTPLPLPAPADQAAAEFLNPATDRPTAAVDLVSGWLVLSALVVAVGGALFALSCLVPALAGAGREGAQLAVRLHRRFFFLTLACAVLGAIAAFISLLAKAEIATGLPPSDLVSGAVLGALLQPFAGRVWLAREAVFALLALCAVAGVLGIRQRLTPAEGTVGPWIRAMLAAVSLLGAAGLICQALSSHLAAGHMARPGPLGTLDLCLHLLAVAAWVGGLGYAALLLRPIWRRLSPETQAAIASVAIARFSPLALASVAVLTLTGIYAAILLLPTPGDLLASAYGQALDVKLALLLVLVCFGAANRRTLGRVAAARGGKGAGAPAVDAAAATLIPSGRRLLQAMRWEFALAAVVLLAAGTMLEVGPPGAALAAGAVKLDDTVVLAALPATPTPVPPTATPRPTATPAGYADAVASGDLTLQLTAQPAVAGATSDLTVLARGAGGTPASNAEVKLRLTAQAIDLGTQVLTAAQVGPGRYTVAAPAFAVPGDWEVLVVVRRDNVPEVDATFTVPVRAPAAAVVSSTAIPAPAATPATALLHATLTLRPNPPVVGTDAATLRLSDAGGRPVTATQLQASWLMPEHAHLTQPIFTAVPGQPGTYAADADLSMAGAWLATTAVTLADGRAAQLQFAFNVNDRGLVGAGGSDRSTLSMSAEREPSAGDGVRRPQQ